MGNRGMMALVLLAMVGRAAGVAVPVTDVKGVRDDASRAYPSRVVAVEDVAVRPQVSGEILDVRFQNGAAVRKGEALYVIDSVQYVAAEKTAEAKVVELKARLAYDEVAVTRHIELVKSRAVSQDDMDRALSSRDATRAALAAAEATLTGAKDDVRHCTVVAPIDGRVGTTEFTAGNFVAKGGSPLVRLVRTNPVRVRLPLANLDYAATYGSDVGRIVAEGRVSVKLVSDGAVVATGRVEYVENVADPATDTVAVHALIDNADGRLLPGQSVIATLASSAGTPRPALPPNAVAMDIRGTYVWVLGADGRAERRYVSRGALKDGLQLIVSGLNIGERVVADGVHRVHEGEAVEAEEAAK